jgi:cathepsin F
MLKYNKVYTSAEEYQIRLGYFQRNMQRLNMQKQTMLANGQSSWTVGVTQFFDLSPSEFAMWAGARKYSAEELAISCLAHGVTSPRLDTRAIPTSFDWRTHSPPVVNPVKNQGQCGSCWAFSTIGVIESAWAIKGNPLTEFSEQEVVDCSVGCSNEPPYGKVCNQGCNGGWQWNAFEDIIGWKGVELETKYPYTAQTGTCQRASRGPASAALSNYTCLSQPQGAIANEDQMAAYLVANGPIAIAMDAGVLESYTGGIIVPSEGTCSQVQLDHAIVIVGYDFTGSIPYWIVRNSWAETWGEQGYFRIKKGVNACGLAAAVSAPILG